MTKLILAAVAAISLASSAQAQQGASVGLTTDYRLNQSAEGAFGRDRNSRHGVSFTLPGDELLRSSPNESDPGAEEALASNPISLALAAQERADVQHDNPVRLEAAVVEVGVKYHF